MIGAHVGLFTYVWHYLVARLLYDGLLRPMLRGGIRTILVVIACTCLALLVYRRRRARVGRRGSP